MRLASSVLAAWAAAATPAGPPPAEAPLLTEADSSRGGATRSTGTPIHEPRAARSPLGLLSADADLLLDFAGRPGRD
jgi:hypothetical protein